MTANINFSSVDQALNEAFKEAMFLLGQEFTKAITDNVWEWPNPPSPRNIVDTGRLRSSQQVNFQGEGIATFSWPVDYAIYVHQGYTMRDGSTFPGRPWTTKALETFDVSATISTLLQRKLGNV